MLNIKKILIILIIILSLAGSYVIYRIYAVDNGLKTPKDNTSPSTIAVVSPSSSETPSSSASTTATTKKKSNSPTSTSTSSSSGSGGNGSGSDSESVSGGGGSGSSGDTSYWKPSVGNSFQIQFTGTLDTSVNANIYDIDLFDNSSSVVSSLHSQGKKAICYLDAGSFENWRDDAGDFPSSVLGNVYSGYPDEKWLDIRQIDILSPIIGARLDLCKSKGFDGVEPDNINGYQNNTGFPLSAQDQLTYNKWLANQAHSRGLSIGLKNDTDQMNNLLSYFDWLVIESCYNQGWCNDAKLFISAGKPVFQIEYTEDGTTTSQFCPQSISNNFYGILKHQNLDSWRETCQ